MAIVRKLISNKQSKTIYLPKDWVEIQETKAGRKIVAVLIVMTDVLTVSPLFDLPVEGKET